MGAKQIILLLKLLICLVTDFLLINFFLKKINIDESGFIIVIYIIPFIIVINFFFSLILYLIFKNYYKIFILNAFLMAFLFFAIYQKESEKKKNKDFNIWLFTYDENDYKIIHWVNNDDYKINNIINKKFMVGVSKGKTLYKEDKLFLVSDSTEYYIKDNFLFKFKSSDSIKLIQER